MRMFTKAIVMIGSVFALTAGSALSVSADDNAYIKYRQSAMKAMSGHISGAVAIIKGEVPYTDDLVTQVTGLRVAAPIAGSSQATPSSSAGL